MAYLKGLDRAQAQCRHRLHASKWAGPRHTSFTDPKSDVRWSFHCLASLSWQEQGTSSEAEISKDLTSFASHLVVGLQYSQGRVAPPVHQVCVGQEEKGQGHLCSRW